MKEEINILNCPNCGSSFKPTTVQGTFCRRCECGNWIEYEVFKPKIMYRAELSKNST